MILPEPYHIDNLMLANDEVFILAAGFEDRVLNFPQLLDSRSVGKDVLLLEYLPFIANNRKDDIKIIIETKGFSLTEIEYNRYSPDDFDFRLKNYFEKHNAKSICLDVSGLSRLAIMIIMDVVREKSLSLRILFTEAKEYAPSQEEFEEAKAKELQHLPTSFIHTGVYDVIHVQQLSSIKMQNRATVLIVFDSFNEALCQALINRINPSMLVLINGRPPRKELEWREEATAYVHHRLREEWSSGTENENISTSTLYYKDTYEQLKKLYWDYSSTHRIILSPTGSKMQTIGCYLLRAIHSDIHIEYPTAHGFFAQKYSKGVRDNWVIDFGNFGHLVKELRNEEISEHLGLPSQIIDVDIK
jgi:hypothetical protein